MLAWHVPFMQTSPVEHGFWSLHSVPFGAFVWTHSPVTGSQEATLHGSVGAGHVTLVITVQVPFLHCCVVHRSASVSHGVVSGRFSLTHCPVAGLQTFALQGSVLGGQVARETTVHVPFWHCCVVHRSLSVSHGVVSSAFASTHRPVVGSQVAILHGLPGGGHCVLETTTHVPFWHVCSVHRSASVSHGVSFATLRVTHSPLVGSQTFTWHGFVLAGHVFCGPATHWPFWQMSIVHGSLSRSHGVPFGWNASGGHAAEPPVHVSGTSHGPAGGRQIVPAATNPFCGQVAELPVQSAISSHASLASRQGVPAGLNSFSGHWFEVPVQNSGRSQSPAAWRHTVPASTSGFGGHVAELPLHVAIPAHGPLDSRHGKPAGWNWFSGHVAEAPVQNSGRSHGPAASRHTTSAARNGLSGHTAELPVHVAMPAHGPVASRHGKPAGWNWFAGHSRAVPVQTSATSHGPAA